MGGGTQQVGEASWEVTTEGGKYSVLCPVEKVEKKGRSQLGDKHEPRPRVGNWFQEWQVEPARVAATQWLADIEAG